MFPSAKDKINQMYQKEYGLSEIQVKAITDISKDFDETKATNTIYPDTFPTNKRLKEIFGTNSEKYIKKIEANAQYLNVSIFKK